MPVLSLLSLIYRNWPKQLGMVSPELPGKVLIMPNGTERQTTLRKRSVTVGINGE
jgi:hypothetical protein